MSGDVQPGRDRRTASHPLPLIRLSSGRRLPHRARRGSRPGCGFSARAPGSPRWCRISWAGGERECRAAVARGCMAGGKSGNKTDGIVLAALGGMLARGAALGWAFAVKALAKLPNNIDDTVCDKGGYALHTDPATYQFLPSGHEVPLPPEVGLSLHSEDEQHDSDTAVAFGPLETNVGGMETEPFPSPSYWMAYHAGIKRTTAPVSCTASRGRSLRLPFLPGPLRYPRGGELPRLEGGGRRAHAGAVPGRGEGGTARLRFPLRGRAGEGADGVRRVSWPAQRPGPRPL